MLAGFVGAGACAGVVRGCTEAGVAGGTSAKCSIIVHNKECDTIPSLLPSNALGATLQRCGTKSALLAARLR